MTDSPEDEAALEADAKAYHADDLVKRLRWLGDHASFEPHMHHVAADRIEELEALLEQRDAFIVSKDLWFEFVDSAALAWEKKE